MSFMTNAAHNVMKGNLELDPECYKGLRKKRQKMLDVGWVKSKKERKRNLRKYGGSLGRDLSKVVPQCFRMSTTGGGSSSRKFVTEELLTKLNTVLEQAIQAAAPY